jgi:hypothetical protein
MRKLFIGGAAALALSTAAQAAKYDAFASFDGTQSGVFKYLATPSGPGPATTLQPHDLCVIPGTTCLELPGGGLPGAYKSTTEFDYLTFTVPDDRLLVHPGPSTNLSVLFVAPQAGSYDFTATFNIVDTSPTGVGIFQFSNAGGTIVSQPVGAIGAQNPYFVKSGSVQLTAGQFLAFGINNLGNYSNDSTGFNFVLTTGAVPEPAAWAMMLAGFGLLGSTMRRRARGVAYA